MSLNNAKRLKEILTYANNYVAAVERDSLTGHVKPIVITHLNYRTFRQKPSGPSQTHTQNGFMMSILTRE